MDGNGRWAKANGVPTIQGHRRGADVARAITERAAKLGVEFLTLYTFSFENWRRDMGWIEDFMGLLRWFFKDQLKDLIENEVRIRVIGDISRFPQDIQRLIEDVQEQTANNTRITVQLALSYSGRNELVRAIKKMVGNAKNGDLSVDDITEENVERYLDTAGVPDPELMIRTSGEMRISNYMLWQMAYTEYAFTPTYWPDYTVEEFESAIHQYQTRERRFGG
jgi:undecaprenyl diphosphate synthase